MWYLNKIYVFNYIDCILLIGIKYAVIDNSFKSGVCIYLISYCFNLILLFIFVLGELRQIFKKSSLGTNSKTTFEKSKWMWSIGRYKVKKSFKNKLYIYNEVLMTFCIKISN